MYGVPGIVGRVCDLDDGDVLGKPFWWVTLFLSSSSSICQAQTLTNLYIFLSLPPPFRPAPFPRFFSLFFGDIDNGSVVVPVLAQRRDISVNLTTQSSSLPAPCPLRMSLSFRELFFGNSGFAPSLGLGRLVDKWRLAVDGDTSERGVSPIKRRLDFGNNNTLSPSNPAILPQISLVSSRSSSPIFSSSKALTTPSISSTISTVFSYSFKLGSVWYNRFWNMSGYLISR